MKIDLATFTLAFTALFSCSQLYAATGDGNSISGLPPTNVPGGIYVMQLEPGISNITFESRVAMTVGNSALIAIPINTKPGTHQVSFKRNGQLESASFEVVDKTYTEQHITLENQAMVDPPEETLKRIRSELTRQRSLYRQIRDPMDLSAGFHKPLEGITTSLYGHRRFFNGKPRSPHSGLDIAAPEGTPIKAAAAGTVTLADDLYYNGKTIFLDHGQGLITMYCHMSELSVKEGDVVLPEQTIGLVGTTGRSTGPHLHWSVSLAGYRVDPELFMRVFDSASQNL
ncbi:MAG: peptidoglycan DD-metalloendopeptidase family protein [Pseudomonadota bacterium]